MIIRFAHYHFVPIRNKKTKESNPTMQHQFNDSAATDDYIKMDYSLTTPQERNEKVKEIIANTPEERLTPAYLEKLADYIVFALDKEEKKSKKVLTDNRMVTVNKREMSFEGLVNKLESGEDGLYNLISNDKNIIFQPKTSITAEDVKEIPYLAELKKSIESIEKQLKTASGRRAYLLKKQLIEMRQDQYVIKAAYRKPIYCINVLKSLYKANLDENIWVAADGDPISDGIVNFFNESHISALLQDYSRIVQDGYDKLNEDSKWMMMDLDNLIDAALQKSHPLYYDLLIYKIDGRTNLEIQSLLQEKYGIKHSVEYISCLWRNKIPKMIATAAADQYLDWHYTYKERGKWKKCTRCGEVKLAHNKYFSRNSSSKDGFYSICKECRRGGSVKIQPRPIPASSGGRKGGE